MTDIRARILQEALPHVPFDGWTEHTLREAAKRAGVSEAERLKAFAQVRGCIDYFLASADLSLEQRRPAGMLASMRMAERIETLILARLDYFLPHREALRRAMAYSALPWNAPHAARTLAKTIDIIWALAGDSSTDFNYYTKRMTLAAIYSSTLLFWLNDHSDNYADTAGFLKRRLKNAADFGKWKQKIKSRVK